MKVFDEVAEDDDDLRKKMREKNAVGLNGFVHANGDGTWKAGVMFDGIPSEAAARNGAAKLLRMTMRSIEEIAGEPMGVMKVKGEKDEDRFMEKRDG